MRIYLPQVLPGLLAMAAVVNGQNPDEGAVFKMDVPRVVLYVTVREGKAKYVGDLNKEAFSIRDNGVPQEIISFSRDDVPVAIGLLVDNSQSMMNKRNEVVDAAKAFVRACNPRDEIFILHFNEKITYGLPKEIPFTGDQGELDKALESMQLDGRTALYDAIHEGLSHLETSKLTKKALVVLSDGGDNMSVKKADEVVQEADLSGALFYGIGIYDPMDGDANPGVLRKLAKDTGGEVHFPKDLQEVKGLFEIMARDLRSQYTISYSPANQTNDGKYHNLQVKVKDPQRRKLIVRTRTGYYATENKKGAGKKTP